MKYQVGDDILVLHSNEEGKVIEIINDNMVLIEVRGVKFPAYMDQIDFPYFHRFTKKKVVEAPKPAPKQYADNIPKEKPTPNQIKVEDGVWLSFLPKFSYDEFDDEIVDYFKVYLVNKTDNAYKFSYRQQFANGTEGFGLDNEIHRFQDFYLHDVPFDDLSNNPAFIFEFSLVKPDKKKENYYETNVKLKGKQVFKRIEEMKEKNEPSISYQLFARYPEKKEDDRIEVSALAAKGYKVYDLSNIRQHLPQPRSVVDLHIEKLSNNWEQMSNLEILNIQLREFEKWYELAVAHHQATLIIIHGVGSGRLRDEIHDLLKVRKDVKTFINKYDARFGYGATEIFFQY
ncbi:Smr/MutS family protein [Filimonas effusa]|uniref:Smr domain-containing protein n=1 Tax=Filimonas effusa TaxID=2508721 RepID=A0A4Q1DA50_9BACT|nr:Smr/MutS family protein [Filimonas effusa]RXK86262.1 hypothetical protein ESB13_05495 [Filimonas effusa]